ncbi:MAG: tannase/feruloyl esterase family alpha/beta hydrolase [Cyclobacteriaceae bacterium]
MKIITSIFLLFLAFVPLMLSGQIVANTKPCTPCEKLKELQLPDVTILKIESLANDTIKNQAGSISLVITVPFCRVSGRISKEINFELLLPVQWNGRFLMSGGGGFVGSIQNNLREYVNRGYATAGTDTGHQGNGLSAEWALNNMERQINFGRLAIHRTAVVSKAVMHGFYCTYPAYSYFLGCSRGGGQAMVEAQFYPEDFEGIVAGAPAFSWPAIGAKFIQGCQKNYPNPKDLSKPVITNDNLKLLQEYVLKQCDKIDGLSDKIINDPRDCKFDFSKMPLCADDKPTPSCITQEQLTAIKSIYSPVMVDNKMIYPGFPFGLEDERGSWDSWISGTSKNLQNAPSLHYMFGTNMFKYLVYNDPSWDYSQYDFKNFFEETRYASSYLDATQTDYNDFKKHKRKMIMYHGWNDPALSAYATIQHYEEAQQKDKDLQSYIRLFLLPGVLHCGGGTGPDFIDWVKQIENWVENGKAPDRIVLSKSENGKAVMTRPVFPYPKLTIYNGKGDSNLDSNFKVKSN